MTTAHELDEVARRTRQAAIGLFIEPESTTNNPKDTDTMQENTATHSNRTSRATQVLEHLSKPPTFKEVAVYEAKKAAVWAPILATTLLGAFWVNKRFILKAATRL
jgi:hypothetical protein